ncbi:MAG TPA: hypothetical protein VNG04_13415 [Candidatus Acidoferrum sp.]|nr:hypothetical protein [Candidatus Acidoferrum sp.]
MSVYGIMADLRREHPTPAAMQTLDLVAAELGKTRDNLKDAVANLSDKPLPPGGKPVLDELVGRAREAGVYDLDYGPDPYDKPPAEALDEATLGIGALLALSSVAALGLAIAAVVIGLVAIFHTTSG